MTRKPWFSFYFLLFCLVFQVSLANAKNVSAASCNATDVQSAINSAAAGDTVVVPAGSCSWTSTVNINSKGVTLQGAGSSSTIITDSSSGTSALNVNGASVANFVRVTGFQFVANTKHTNGMIQFDGTNAAVAFRVDHNKLVISQGSRGIAVSNLYGLIDNNTIDESGAGSGASQSVSLTGCSDGTDGGFTCWNRPESLGTINAVYIEDNNIIYPVNPGFNDTGFDSYGGARWVIRHNTVSNTEFGGGHGTDSGNRRSMFSGEIYENKFTNNSGGSRRAGTFRGGTGVAFNNTYTSSDSASKWNGYTLMLYRACGMDDSMWGPCDGTQYVIGSTSFSATGSRQTHTYTGTVGSSDVAFCQENKDQVCTSSSSGCTCTALFDGPSSPSSGMCRDQPGKTHGQVTDPFYTWNNNYNGTMLGAGTYDGGTGCAVDQYVKNGRDYINGGTTPKPGYTAFTYPHPLQSSGGSNPPPTTVNPPSGLSAIVQ